MTIALRQSTASQEVLLGPFVDSTDGVTAETGLTIANTDIKIHKAGATTLASKNSGGATHISNGNYYAVLDATDTDTVGSGAIVVQVSGALAFRLNFHVYEEAVYDMLYGASAVGYISNAPVNVAQFGGSNLTAASGIPEVKVASIANNAITAAAINADAITDAKVASDVTIASVTGAVGSVTGNVGGNVTGSVGSVAAGGITASSIAADAIGASELAADAATEIATAVWATAARTLTAATNITSTGGTTVPQTGDSYARLGAPAGASLSADVAAVKTDTGNILTKLLKYVQLIVRKDSAIATDNATELTAINANGGSGAGAFANTTDALEALRDRGDAAWTTATGFSTLDASGVRSAVGLASANLDTQLTAIDDYLDTEVAAIKAKTDSLTFTTAGQVDAQVLSMAANTLTAAATASDFGTEVATAVWASATRTLSALGFTLGASDLAADTIGASELASDAITEIVNAVLTTAMTESYNTDGAAPTLAQAMFVTMQRLTEFAISGTTVTVKKLDGSTSAYTLTLDSATDPTSTTRAT